MVFLESDQIFSYYPERERMERKKKNRRGGNSIISNEKKGWQIFIHFECDNNERERKNNRIR